MNRPSYTSSRRLIWASFALAWALIIAVTAYAVTGSEQAVALANILIPSMIGLIVGTLGVHRFAGALDYRAGQRNPPPEGDAGEDGR